VMNSRRRMAQLRRCRIDPPSETISEVAVVVSKQI
jgi:hypothetical protein